MKIEALGWVAGLLFAFCGLPQAIQSHKTGNSNGLSGLTLSMWFTGEVLSLAYVFLKHGWDLPLLFNYGCNLLFLLVIIKYKVYPRV